MNNIRRGHLGREGRRKRRRGKSPSGPCQAVLNMAVATKSQAVKFFQFSRLLRTLIIPLCAPFHLSSFTNFIPLSFTVFIFLPSKLNSNSNMLVDGEKFESGFQHVGQRQAPNELDNEAIEEDATSEEEEEIWTCANSPEMEETKEKAKRLILLDGNNLSVEDLVDCANDKCQLQLTASARQRIVEARKFLEKVAAEHRIIYGITTGFGTFANVEIPPDDLKQLQLNLIRSHATGYGDPLEPAKARMLLALRINVLAKGHSGISPENVEKLIKAFNAFCVSFVPEQGTVGCSGDLCPLAHLALGLLGEGEMWSPLTGWAPAGEVLKQNGLEPIDLGYKEGLALINGTQMVSALGAMAVVRAENVAKQADVIAALTLDVLKGTTRAFDAKVHKVRPHKGQNMVAGRLRALLHSDLNRSEIAESHRNCGKVQDAYTLRCVPQVHGVVHDTIEFVKGIIGTEINSATDNPLVFSDVEEVISGGNFHGEYPAKVLDYLAIAIHELAQISERRLERLVNHELSGLPTFLTRNGGLNSGFMTVQLCAASLVSENKVLCHPSSADSIPTSCNQEDHVSMGGFAARKALKVVEHTEAVLAMELLAACQGMEFLKPLNSTDTLQKVYDLVRTVSPPLDQDRYIHPEIQAVIGLVRTNQIWEVVEPHLTRMTQMESSRPDLLRQEAGSPTAAVLGLPDFSRVL